MDLTTAENGDVTLSKDRHGVCMEIAWELEALAYTLPQVTSNSDISGLNSGFVVRGIAGRYVTLSNALLQALFDDGVKTDAISRDVLVVPYMGED